LKWTKQAEKDAARIKRDAPEGVVVVLRMWGHFPPK
jgi:hypothetical protein